MPGNHPKGPVFGRQINETVVQARYILVVTKSGEVAGFDRNQQLSKFGSELMDNFCTSTYKVTRLQMYMKKQKKLG